jgi:hypothetical protein
VEAKVGSGLTAAPPAAQPGLVTVDLEGLEAPKPPDSGY